MKKETEKKIIKIKVFKIKNIFIISLILILFSSLLISSMNIIKWFKDNKKTSVIINKIENSTAPINKIDSENTEIIQNEDIKETDPYWDYIKMNLMEVNFDELYKLNHEVKGWIQVNGTNVNYPFVQTNNNDFYLTHDLEKKWNDAGWIFMDYRNNSVEFDKNTIIYGHARLDTTMFGSLKNIIKSKWYNNKDNYIVKLSTPTHNTMWQVFSVYHIPTTNDYIQTTFYSDEDYENFLNLIKNRSIANFKTTVNINDKILTLSTCYRNDEKIVLHAKLIKKETR